METNKTQGKQSTTDKAPRTLDWFFPVLEVNGSVSTCLLHLSSDLALKTKFVEALNQKIGDDSNDGIDRLSQIKQRIRIFENTIEYRLKNLSSEKILSWFRNHTGNPLGPFQQSIYCEKFLPAFPAANLSLTKQKIMHCLQERAQKLFPLPDQANLLWILLEIYKQLEDLRYVSIDNRGAHITIDLNNFESSLPSVLRSPILDRFLQNVRTQYLECQKRLDTCRHYMDARLREFFIHYQKDQSKNAQDQMQWNQSAQKIREDFSQKRKGASKSKGELPRIPQDDIALRFFNFQNFPTLKELRQKYVEMAKKFHPDIRTQNDDDQFKKLARHYAHLKERISLREKQS